MNTSSRHPLIFLLVLSATLVAGTGCVSDPAPGMFSTGLDYKLHIISTGPLTNVTFYLPLPVRYGTPSAGTVVLTKKYYERGDVSVDFVRFPPGMDRNWTSPLQNAEPLFLKITADSFYPNETNGTGYTFFFENRTSLDTPLAFPETAFPIGNESVFLQKVNFTPATPVPIPSKDPDLTEYRPVEVNQKMMIYADYSADPSTWVNVYSQVIVMNNWKYRGENMENFYADSYTWFNTGEAHGWQIAKGLFGTGVGQYPNLSRPVWQNVLDQSARS
ncbi:MAG: hypothetical protein A4E35_01584 [Methanoregula sp. PtaU1.Bin051]|nr:MAG: hypothetical protein A4E35_01584 [Methanoregula sp. PtaU1.Bin051]